MTVHCVSRDDSPESLSARYRVPVCMIMRANGIKTTKDFERCRRINIPRACYCNRCEGEERTEWRIVTALPGDTLYSIARRCGVTMHILMKANNLAGPDSVREGDKLSVPVVTGELYSVREGETIESIARQRGLLARRIRERNGFAPGEPVYAGMQLLID